MTPSHAMGSNKPILYLPKALFTFSCRRTEYCSPYSEAGEGKNRAVLFYSPFSTAYPFPLHLTMHFSAAQTLA